MNIIEATHPLSDEQRSEIIFAGDLLLFRQLPSMLALCQYVDRFMSEALGGGSPEQAIHNLSPEDYLQFIIDMQQRFQEDPETKKLFFQVLQETGVNLGSTFYDYFPMRVVSAQEKFTSGLRTTVGHHRDTWGGNVQAQCNWWAPIYDIEAERSMAFYPDYWDKATVNTTADWEFSKYLAARKETPKGEKVPYPGAPELLETIDESNAFKVVLSAGDVLNFSSAHLHATVPNTTELTRYSVEMRTINLADLQAGRGAPNIDNAAKTIRYNWYRNALDNSSLKDHIG